MVVLIEPCLRVFPLVWLLALAFDVDRLVDIHPDAFGALHTETKRIGAWKVRVMLQKDRLIICSPYHGRYYITKFESHFRIGMIFAAHLHDVLVQSAGL